LTSDAHADPGLLVRAGGWLFRQRTWIPVPLAAALLVFPAAPSPSVWLAVVGVAVVALAEVLRLWAVRSIGAISRTRSERLGPLIQTGPFAFVRNPLYLGNVGLWTGMALIARLAWLVPVFIVLLAIEYGAIVRWEEHLLRERRGDEYCAYAARVPRWTPWIGPRTAGAIAPTKLSWRETLFSERGTLIAIGAGLLLLWLKNRA
jgi:protein-S-isoprenylcysteine O-methyltransferase Ste14